MGITTDLTKFSTNFPNLTEPQISRESFVGLLRDTIGPNQKVVVVQGVQGAGKTNLLAQFVRTFPDRCFSFFIGNDSLTSSLRAFLLDICEQIFCALDEDVPDLDEYDTDRLTQKYGDLLRRLARKAKSASHPYYFVIDGLEKIDTTTTEITIINLLPKDQRANIYLLASCTQSFHLPFSSYVWRIPSFEERDTEQYLNGLDLSVDQVHTIHLRCGGLPGHLAAIRRLLLSRVPFQEVEQRLSGELQELYLLEWSRIYTQANAPLRSALALLTYAKQPLTVAQLGEMTKVNAVELSDQIASVSFLTERLTSNRGTNVAEVRFVADLFKDFAAKQLLTEKAETEELLVEYCKNHLSEKNSYVVLPEYLAQPSTYNQLKSYVTTEYLTLGLTRYRDIGSLQSTLRLAADQAHQAEDWQTLVRYILANSLLHTVARYPVAEAEIDALLELGEYEQAQTIAAQSLLPEDRLQLLARVFSCMQRSGHPVEQQALNAMEALATDIDTSSLKERALDIAAVLFALLPQSAIALFERAVGTTNGSKALDAARAILALRLEVESETESDDLIRSRISDQALRDFVRLNSPRTARYKPDEILLEAENVKETSGKLLMLTSWCNANRENPDAFAVVGKALEAITSDPEYPTPMRLLRQLAEPLKNISPEVARPLVDRLKLLKATAIAQPVEELLRLELILATVSAKESQNQGETELLEAFYDFEEHPASKDLDVRCYGLARILISLRDIQPANILRWQRDVETVLTSSFKELLENSADHLAITRRLLSALTTYDAKLAFNFASQLNLSTRRNKAVAEILWVYLDRAVDLIEIDFVKTLIQYVSDEEFDQREQMIAMLIERIAELNLFDKLPDTRTFLEWIPGLRDPRKRCYSYAFAIKALGIIGETSTVEIFATHLRKSLSVIDSRWERVQLGFALISIVGHHAQELGRHLLEKANQERNQSPLSESSFAEMYVNFVRLSLRSYSGLLIDNFDYQAESVQLIKLIQYIPSFSTQIMLYANLALRYHLADKSAEFKRIVEQHILPLLDKCIDNEARNDALIQLGSCLFEYEPLLAIGKIKELPLSKQDQSLLNIVIYLLTQKVPGDPIDLDSLHSEVSLRAARQICQVISYINYDYNVFPAITTLIDGLIQPNTNIRNPKKEICNTLIERNILELISSIHDTASAKFPDPRNIKQHSGYQIATAASLARLNLAASWRTKPIPPWVGLAHDANAIDNKADRVYVLAHLGEVMSKIEPNGAATNLRNAEQVVQLIPNLFDRAGRFYMIASAWKDAEEDQSARMLIEEVMKLLNVTTWDQKGDQLRGQALQLAHTIDPEFATSLTSLIENPLEEHFARLKLTSHSLRKDPQKLSQQTDVHPRELERMLADAAGKMLAELNAGSGNVRSLREIGPWLYRMTDASIEHTFEVVSWFVENTIQLTNQIATRVGLYQEICNCLQLCMDVGQVFRGMSAAPIPLMTSSSVAVRRTFLAGTRPKAMAFLHGWLTKYCEGKVIIYDPYFSDTELELLKYIPSAIHIFIVTSWASQDKLKPGDFRELELRYRKTWDRISSEPAPWTRIIVLGTIPEPSRTSKSPQHNRYVITKGRGLDLGTSINSLGITDSVIDLMDEEDASHIESEIINPLLNASLRLYQGEELNEHIFSL